MSPQNEVMLSTARYNIFNGHSPFLLGQSESGLGNCIVMLKPRGIASIPAKPSSIFYICNVHASLLFVDPRPRVASYIICVINRLWVWPSTYIVGL